MDDRFQLPRAVVDEFKAAPVRFTGVVLTMITALVGAAVIAWEHRDDTVQVGKLLIVCIATVLAFVGMDRFRRHEARSERVLRTLFVLGLAAVLGLVMMLIELMGTIRAMVSIERDLAVSLRSSYVTTLRVAELAGDAIAAVNMRDSQGVAESLEALEALRQGFDDQDSGDSQSKHAEIFEVIKLLIVMATLVIAGGFWTWWLFCCFSDLRSIVESRSESLSITTSKSKG